MKNKVLAYLKNRRIIKTIIMLNIAVIGIDNANVWPVCEALSDPGTLYDRKYSSYINTSMQIKYWPLNSLNDFDVESKKTPFQYAILVAVFEGSYLDHLKANIIKLPLRVIILVYDRIKMAGNNNLLLDIDNDIQLLNFQATVYYAMKINVGQRAFDCKSFILAKIDSLISATDISDTIKSEETKSDKKTINYGDALKSFDCIWTLEPNEAINEIYLNLYGMYYRQEFPQILDLIKSDDNLKNIFAGVREILSKNIINYDKVQQIKNFLLDFGSKMHS